MLERRKHVVSNLPSHNIEGTEQSRKKGYLNRIVIVLPHGIGVRLAPLVVGDGLKQRAVRSTVWTMIGYGTEQVLRLGSNLILTRLLFPEAFGLMALVGAFMQGLAMFSDIGIRPSIVQNKRGDDPAFYNTAWTIQVLRGVLLTLIAAAIAGPVAHFYDEPMLLQMVPVAGLSALIAGFNSTKIFTANRQLALGRVTFIGLASQIVSIICVILLAWWLRSVWALVIGGLVGTAANTVLAQTLLPGPANRFCWDRTASVELFRFGKWIFFATVFAFFANQLDKLILGKQFTLDTMGLYAIATATFAIPEAIFRQLTGGVAYPTFSRLNSFSPNEFRSRVKSIRQATLLIWSVVSALFVGLVDIFIGLAWDPRYLDAGWMAQVLGLSLLPIGIFHITANMLTARGEPRYHTISQFGSAISIAVLMTVGFVTFGEVGAIFGISLSRITPYIVTTVGAFRCGVSLLNQDLFALLMFVGLATALLWLRWIIGLTPALLQ